jgi:hypothetical protein
MWQAMMRAYWGMAIDWPTIVDTARSCALVWQRKREAALLKRARAAFRRGYRSGRARGPRTVTVIKAW